MGSRLLPSYTQQRHDPTDATHIHSTSTFDGKEMTRIQWTHSTSTATRLSTQRSSRRPQIPPTPSPEDRYLMVDTGRSMPADLLIEQHALQHQHPITRTRLDVLKQYRSNDTTTITRTASTKLNRLTTIGNPRAPTGTAQCHNLVHSLVTLKFCRCEFIPHSMHSHTMMVHAI